MEILSHNNRIDYGKALMPEEGWETSWAIGTTYSLDLEVLLSVPLALFHARYLTGGTTESNLRTDMLDALDKVRRRMFVFVHENNIHANCKYTMLMGFLDQNIWNISLDSPGKNFHPKVWLVRYERKSDNKASTQGYNYKYRLIVMSRNITAATDFDIAVAMDGDHTPKEHKGNEPLVMMMTELMRRTGRKDIIRQLGKELKHVCFMPPQPFDKRGKTAVFWPHAFQGMKSPLLKLNKYDEMMVISPFVDDYTLEELSKKCIQRPPILVCREYEMDRCRPETLNKWKCYMWSPILEEASDYEENETFGSSTASRSIGLHAKIFIVKVAFGRDLQKYNNWFIGSTNCTKAGLQDNYEAQVQLRSIEQGTAAEDVLKSLLEAKLIEPYKVKKTTMRDEIADNEQRRQRELEYRLSHLGFEGSITKNTDGRYITSVKTDTEAWSKFCHDYPNDKVTLQLFAPEMADKDVWLLNDTPRHCFASRKCQLLSPFLRVYIVFASGDKKIFLLQVHMEMPEERHGKIMADILNSEEKLMRYLMFCLDGNIECEQRKIGTEVSKSHNSGNTTAWNQCAYPIYERLLLAASRDKETLRGIRDNIEKLKEVKDNDGKALLSDEFLRMWNMFAIYAK